MSEVTSMPVKCTLRLLIARENLRRAEAGQPELTQQEIAAQSELSQSVISTLASGKSQRIDFETIDKLCEFFNIEPGALFTREPRGKGHA